MNSLLRAGLLAVMVIAGISFNASAAAPVANTELLVNVSVSVPRVIRIQWGSDSTAVDATNASVANTVNPVVWALGPQDFDQTIPFAPTLSIQNAGTARVAIGARVVDVAGVTDSGTAAQKWTLGATNGTDQYVLSVNGTELTTTSQALLGAGLTLKRSDAPLAVSLEFITPDDSNFATGDTGIHAFQISFTATAP